MMVEFVLFLAVAIAPLAAIAVFATGGEDGTGGPCLLRDGPSRSALARVCWKRYSSSVVWS